jgi:hypothetical protein
VKQTSLTVHRYERNVSPAIGKVNVCLFCSEQANHPNHIGYAPMSESERIHAENLARVTSPAYLKQLKAVARSERAIRRQV